VRARSASARTGVRPNGRHLLRSSTLAAELVDSAGIGANDHVVEIGAGTGRLTKALAERAGRVTAIEVDPDDARQLRATFQATPTVDVVEADVLRATLPATPYRAFGNLPFALATSILRRLLDDPAGPLRAADVLIQFESARKRAQVWPSTSMSILWLPWWELSLVRRVSRAAFEPPPSVDAGWLSVRPRPQSLLPLGERKSFTRLVGRAFGRGSWPVRRSLRADIAPMRWKRLARDRGLPVDALPSDLNVFDWVALYRTATETSVRSSGRSRTARS
jgi:23S rRNA (adenine-N6)-dimethyltransferase